MRSDANIAGPMTDPVPGPRTESAGEDVSRETPPPMDDTPIGRAAELAVQALGRALRKPPPQDTKTASLVIPAYVPHGADPTDLLGTPYEALWLVTAALRHHDQTIAARTPRAKNQHPARDSHTYITRRFRFDLDLPPDFFSRMCDAGRAIILLDGLDEVASSDDRAFVSSVVRAFASAAAIMMFSVPVTVIMSKTTAAPVSRLHSAWM